jgi:hypothetical protein
MLHLPVKGGMIMNRTVCLLILVCLTGGGIIERLSLFLVNAA